MDPRRVFWGAYLAWHCRGQERYPFRPLDRIRRDQARRVRGIVAHAYRTVPYYRETMGRLGLTPADFATAADLTKLPLLERAELQRDPEYFLSRAVHAAECQRARSSGSSGAPVTVYLDVASALRTLACSRRSLPIVARYVGRRGGYRATTIASPTSNGLRLAEFCRQHTWVPRRSINEHQLVMLKDPPERNAALVDEFKPDMIVGLGSCFEELFPYLVASGRAFHRPKLVWYSGDSMSDAVRKLLTDELGIPVLSSYQAIEANRMAFECEEHSGLHLNEDLYPLRIVDGEGRSLPVGETGDVVVSNLVNRATVVLNYRLNDLATRLPDPCRCGRTLPLLSFPCGRSEDFLLSSRGERVNPQGVLGAFTLSAPIWRWQLVQESLSRIRVAFVAAPACDRAELTERVAARFHSVLGDGVEVIVEYVSDFERPEGGKHRPVRSLLPAAQRQPTSGRAPARG